MTLKRAAATVVTVLIALATTPLAAQSRGPQRVPPGQLPPAGQCRVWYEGRAPGQQSPVMNCDRAEAIASRDRSARVIYGNQRGRIDNSQRGRRAIDRRGGRGQQFNPAYDNGYRDGVYKGREDADDRDRYDPARHGWYKSANRGYDSRYATRDQYQRFYREGFLAGYDNARVQFDRNGRSGPDRRLPDGSWPWPF
jgi:hypothetical protein